MHDESHDSLEVVAMEGDLTLLRHVDPSGVPRPPTAANPLHPLTPIRRLKCINTIRKTEEQEHTYIESLCLWLSEMMLSTL